MEFLFSDDDLNVQASSSESKFDKMLLSGWHSAMKAGYFRYSVDDVQTKIAPGKLNFVIKHNRKRFVERRRPIAVMALNEPFNPDKFNFTKVAKDEIIAYLRHSAEKEGSSENDCPLLINISPLDVGHVLIVPHCQQGFNQILREDAIVMALRMLLLSNSKYFFVGYNSLLAHASVNHLHWHGWYTDCMLPSCFADIKQISKKHSLYIFENYPVNGFVFVLEDASNLRRICHLIAVLVNHLHNSNIPHNVLMLRGPIPKADGDTNAVRICIWPRLPCSNDENGTNRYNTACVEIGGMIIIQSKEDFANLDETTISSDLKKNVDLGDEIFNKLTTECLQRLEEA